MQPKIRYFVQKDRDGSILALARIHDDETGLWGEFLEDGEWAESHVATDFLVDPSYGDPISEEEAAKIAPQFGGRL